MNVNRKSSLLFVLVALAFAYIPLALFTFEGPLPLGGQVRRMLSDSGARELLVVSLIPALWAAFLAVVLWRLSPEVKRVPASLVAGSLVVSFGLLFSGFLVLAVMFAAATVPLVLGRRAVGA